MKWTSYYNPPTSSLWTGRSDAPPHSCFYQQIQLLNMHEHITPHTTPAIALVGFSCDEGIRRNFGRVGAAEGPAALREVLAKLPLHRQDFICYDAGDIHCADNHLENAQAALGELIFTLLRHNITPLVIGGGHEVAWGHYQGIAKQFPIDNLGIINFDAHFDMRPLVNQQGSSGTPFLQIAEAHQQENRPFHYYCYGIQHTGNIQALFNTAEYYQTQVVYAEEIQQGKTPDLIAKLIKTHQRIYLSLCLDVFASAYAPGVSAPQALGLSPWQVIPAVRELAESGKVISYDIAELSPYYDIDSRTIKLTANLIYEIIHHHTF
jgi:formiminoglutamase